MQEEALSPALRSGNRELETELRVQEGVELRVVELREKLRGVALSAFSRSRQFRLLRSVFAEWVGWVGYTLHREGVQRRAIEVMKKSTRMKVWRAWMGWAAAKQMEERIDEIKEQVEAQGGGSPVGSPVSAASDDLSSDPYRDAEEMGRTIEGSLLTGASGMPARASHRVEWSELARETAGLRAAYTLAMDHGIEGAQVLLQRALTPRTSGSTAPEACGDLAGRSAAFGLAALPPRIATAVQPKLAAVLRSAKDAGVRELAAWVLGEWATMPGACSTEVLAALTVALVGDGSRSGAQGEVTMLCFVVAISFLTACFCVQVRETQSRQCALRRQRLSATWVRRWPCVRLLVVPVGAWRSSSRG